MAYSPLLRFWTPTTRHDQRTAGNAYAAVTDFALASFWLRRVGGCSNGTIRIDQRQLQGEPLMHWVGVWFDRDATDPWWVGQIVAIELQDESRLLECDGAYTRHLGELALFGDYGPESDPTHGDATKDTLAKVLDALLVAHVRTQNHPYLRYSTADAAALALPNRPVERLLYNGADADRALRDLADMAGQAALGVDWNGSIYCMPNGHRGTLSLRQQPRGVGSAGASPSPGAPPARAEVLQRPRVRLNGRTLLANDLTLRGGMLAAGRPYNQVYVHPWSIMAWGRRRKTLSVPSVRTYLDGLNYAHSYFQRYAHPGVEVELMKLDYTSQRIMPGQYNAIVYGPDGTAYNDTDGRDAHWIEAVNYTFQAHHYEITAMVGRARDSEQLLREARDNRINELLAEREPTGRPPSQSGAFDYLDTDGDGIPDAFEGPLPFDLDSVGDTGLPIPPFTVEGSPPPDWPYSDIPDPLGHYVEPGNPWDTEIWGSGTQGASGAVTGPTAGRITLATQVYASTADNALRGTLGQLLALVNNDPGDPENTAATLVLGDLSYAEIDGEKRRIDWIVVNGRAQTRLPALGVGLIVEGSGDDAVVRLHYGHGIRIAEDGEASVAPYFEAP